MPAVNVNIPLGYFFLQSPPEEQIKLLESRVRR